MIDRSQLKNRILAALDQQSAVALIGARQVGKTTLAHEIAAEKDALYLDLESQSDLNKLSAPELFFREHAGRLIILDEIHHAPEIFRVLRGHIDRQRRAGFPNGQFLILGSAAISLLQQTSESLAGRITFIDVEPISINELSSTSIETSQLWLRGGFPQSLLAPSDAASLEFRNNFIRTYLERDVPQFGPRIPAERLRRLWTMLAHNHGQLLNSAQLANSLELSATTVNRYIDLLTDLLMLRRLEPLFVNTKKRLVKSPKVYLRDSGLLHALLNIEDSEALAGHTIVGASWEGFVLESILAEAPRNSATFYRTQAGAEVDLCLDLEGSRGRWAIEIKRGLSPSASRGLRHAMESLQPDKTFIVYSGDGDYPIDEFIRVISLPILLAKLRKK